ncbi:MAG: hypothetical protein JNL98_39580, partial [Bryobacterales bacterium]|nr:hypothetical protein [Bryobacterales bacterium]
MLDFQHYWEATAKPFECVPSSGMTAFANLPVMGAKNAAGVQPNQQIIRI